MLVQPSGGAATAATATTAGVPLLEPSLVDVLLCQTRHTLTLFNHFTVVSPMCTGGLG